jgi:hypothetical protein
MSSQRNAQSFATVTADRTEQVMSDYSFMSDSDIKPKGNDLHPFPDDYQNYPFNGVGQSHSTDEGGKLELLCPLHVRIKTSDGIVPLEISSQFDDSGASSEDREISTWYSYNIQSDDNVDIVVDYAKCSSKSAEENSRTT